MRNLETFFPQLQRLLLVLFFVCVGMIWIKSLKILTTDEDTSYPESALVQTARLASQSGRLYPPLDAPPYTPAPYGPLFYLLLAGAGRVCKGNDFEIRLLLRSIVFGSYLAVGLVGYLLARNAGASRSAAALGAAAIWAAPQLMMFWNVTARPDFPGLLLSLLGIWVISRRAPSTLGAVILSGVCCAAALLIKQSFIAAPLALSMFLILRRSYRNFILFAASGLFVGLSVVGYLTLRGEPVVREMLLIGHSPLLLHRGAFIFYSSLSVGLAVLVVAGSVAGFLSALRSASRWQQMPLLACYFITALLTFALTVPNIGAAPNYLFEFWTIASVLSTSVVPQAEALWIAVSNPIRIGATIGLLLLATRSLHEILHGNSVPEYNFDRLHDLHILSDDPSLTVRGKEPELLDPFLTTILERQHVWEPSGILDEIAREQFDVVFVNTQIGTYLSPSMFQSFSKYYQPLCRTSTMLVMEPKNRQVRFSLSDASHTLDGECE